MKVQKKSSLGSQFVVGPMLSRVLCQESAAPPLHRHVELRLKNFKIVSSLKFDDKSILQARLKQK